MIALDWIYYLLLLALLVTGLFVNILGLPGLWLMVAAFGTYAWVTWNRGYVGLTSLVMVIVLALLAELVEFVAGAAGSKVAGGSKRGMAGAIVGGIVGGIAGTPLFPIVGTIIGACLGSFAGAFVIEVAVGRSHEESMRIGFGAAKGRFLGIVAKLAFGIAMLIIALYAAFPTGGAPITPAPAPAPLPPPATAPIFAAPTPTTQPATDAAVERE
ncbi:MAG TPA: DUF456 domain-containing protein [Tepidisphaeraceae bacterium]|nr:DUF456 domain-containing protein [Tepidisphaeraceae bacterium]